MQYDWSKLPERLSYVRSPAENFAALLPHGPYSYERRVAALTRDQIQELARLYEKIESRGDAKAISAWVLENEVKGQVESKTDASTAVFELFGLFDDLAGRGLAPFNTHTIEFWEPDPPFDWSKLPEHLRYLAEPAEKYGGYQ